MQSAVNGWLLQNAGGGELGRAQGARSSRQRQATMNGSNTLSTYHLSMLLLCCHLLVCLQVLLQEREQEQLAQQLQQDSASAEGSAAAAGDSSKQQGKQGKSSGPMRALILTPTRELALQVGQVVGCEDEGGALLFWAVRA